MPNILSFPSSVPPTPVPFIDLTVQYSQISREVLSAVERVLAEQKFVLGEEVASLEQEIAEYCDARHAIGVNSGTDALILALMALDIGPGDEVITTPFSFFATASCIERVGARPVFVDIDPVTFNISPEAIADAITPNTRAIIPVHLYGQCADMESIWRLAVKHGLAVIEDAAQAIGAEYRGRRAGVLGTIGCFSFFPTKNLGGAGDGGMVTTDDPSLAKRIRSLRVHGDVGHYEHAEIGINSRLDALQATILRVKLRSLDSWTEARRENGRTYDAMFEAADLSDAITLPATRPENHHVYNQYVIRVAGRLTRDELQQSLRNQQVGCAVYYPKPLHLQKCFSHLGYREGQLPVSEQASREVLALPIYPELPRAHLEQVVCSVRDACAAHVKALPARRAA